MHRSYHSTMRQRPHSQTTPLNRLSIVEQALISRKAKGWAFCSFAAPESCS